MSAQPLNDVLIDDRRVLTVPIVDGGEAMVPVPIWTTQHARVRSQCESKFMVRADVARRLELADDALSGASIVVVEGHRSIETQTRFWDHRLAAVQRMNPDWDQRRCRIETARFVAPPDDQPPHSTGAAVDVVVVDADGREVDMGSALNDPSGAMATAAPVPPRARMWRDRLVAAMEGAGFVNYPQEWWHFSYGDRYWAWRTGAEAALYGTIGADAGAGSKAR